MRTLKRETIVDILSLFFLLLFHAVNNFIWLRLNTRPPVDDEAYHLLASLRYLDFFHHLGAMHVISGITVIYPPFFHIMAVVMGLVFGPNSVVFAFTNILFIAGIFLCLYCIGIKFKQRRASVLAAYIVSLYPLFFRMSRMVMMEIAVIFAVVASITALVYCEHFKNKFMSVLFGISVGIGLLTKQYYLVFIIGPLLYELVLSFRDSQSLKKTVISNMLLSMLLGIGIASLWYVPNLNAMLAQLRKVIACESFFPPLSAYHFFRGHPFAFYYSVLVKVQISIIFFSVFVLALIGECIFKRREKVFLFIAWIAFPYVVFSLFRSKFMYYTLAYTPAFAFISALGIIHLKNQLIRRTVISIVLGFGVFQFFVVSYDAHYKRIPCVGKILPANAGILAGVQSYPLRGDWKIEDMVRRIKSSSVCIPVVGVFRVEANIELRVCEKAQKDILCRRESYAGTNISFWEYRLEVEGIKNELMVFENVCPSVNDLKKIDFLISPVELKSAYINIPEVFIMPDGSKVFFYEFKRKL